MLGASLDRWGPAAGAAAAALSIASAAAATGIWWWSNRLGLPTFELLPSDLIVAVLNPSIGALLVARQPRNACGYVLLSGGLVGVFVFATQYASYGAVVAPGTLPLVSLATWLAAWTFAAHWLQPSLLALLFPDGKPASHRWRLVAWGVLGCFAAGALAAALRPDADVADLGLANPLGIGPLLWPFAVVMLISAYGTLLGGSALGVTSLVLQLRSATDRRRGQVLWLLLGFGAFLTLSLASLLMPRVLGDWSPDLLFAAAVACIPLAVGIAVVRHQLLDIDLVLNRTVVYAALTVVGLVAYVSAVTAATMLVGERTPAPLVAAVVALVAAAARHRVQAFVDRRLFGARHNPYTVVAQVGEAAESADPAISLRRIVEALRDSLRRPYAAIDQGDRHAPVVASSGDSVAGVEEVPVVWQGQRLAMLQVGLRHRGESVSQEERSALVDVARRVAALLHQVSLAEDLQRSREGLVVAREDERRRLRRDLHDGVGPTLAAVALGLDGLKTRLGDDPALAERADDLRAQVRETVGEIRRIVDGLRPASIDELGLSGAIERLVSRGQDGPTVSAAVDALPPLAAATEVATYRIAAEAVTNAIRHASARRIGIELAREGTELLLVVSDDGCGFGAEAAVGVGLRSMHERAAEVGGRLEVHSRVAGGTKIVARLPIEAA